MSSRRFGGDHTDTTTSKPPSRRLSVIRSATATPPNTSTAYRMARFAGNFALLPTDMDPCIANRMSMFGDSETATQTEWNINSAA